MFTYAAKQRLLTLLIDFFTLSISFAFYYKFRESVSFAAFTEQASMLVAPMLTLTICWMLLFWLFGLYRDWTFGSRFEEGITIIKAISLGTIVLFVLIFADDLIEEQTTEVSREYSSRFGAAMYWTTLSLIVPLGRAAQRSYQRRLLEQGLGRRNALIIGTGKRADALAKDISSHRALGMDVKGFLYECSEPPAEPHPLSLGTIDQLERVLSEARINDVILAVQTARHDDLLRIIGKCEGQNVSVKMLPNMYDIVSGAARTTQIYGTPLVELTPALLSPFEENLKRLFDITASLTVLIFGLPFFLVLGFFVWLDTKASPLYTQVRVGRHGREFTIFKFRSMRANAEGSTPMLTQKNDERITPFGKFLRKYRLDEFPQFWNVLVGDMSIVGPRPERLYFVKQLLEHAPHYARLHRVRPGITSWGQVKFGYAASIEEMLERMKYDLFYIENMSLTMDFKILLATVYVMLTGRGQ